MIPRYAAAMLGLLAFTVTVAGGLVAANPMLLTLERGMFALFLFCLFGFVIGWVAQLVMNEYERSCEAEIMKRFERASEDNKEVQPEEANGSVPDSGLSGA